ncbi:unnamed protein product [Lactuca virosa]|uniref:NAC domain-containing protein n=1 Tax=Lactuca virosa TaxID=75947 RepID=A0AAU9N4U9_9ASTR|nr:unnamed protein product [Lactuca virosa]
METGRESMIVAPPPPPLPPTFVAPGFRFHPTDEELVRCYLRRKVCGKPFQSQMVPEVDIYKSEPWELAGIHNSFWFDDYRAPICSFRVAVWLPMDFSGNNIPQSIDRLHRLTLLTFLHRIQAADSFFPLFTAISDHHRLLALLFHKSIDAAYRYQLWVNSKVYCDFQQISMLAEPLILTSVFFFLFVAAVAYLHMDILIRN